MQTHEFVVSQRELDELDALAAKISRSRGSLTREAVRNACTGYWFMTSGGVPADPETATPPPDGVVVQVALRERELAQLDKLAQEQGSDRARMLRRCVRHLLAHGAAVTPGKDSPSGKKVKEIRDRSGAHSSTGLGPVQWALMALAAAAFFMAVRWYTGG